MDSILTILVGKRPHLTKRTLDALPECLKNVYVLVLNNGGDKPTKKLLRQYDFINRVMTTNTFLSNPEAISLLAREVIKSHKVYWLLLENDWQYHDPGYDWFDQTKALLSDYRIGQVRLRLNSDKVLDRNMVDNKMIDWELKQGFKIGNGHYTNNPNLMRVLDVHFVWPAISEQHAQRRFYYKKWHVAQLIPGLFTHIGNNQSLEGHAKWPQ